MAHHPCAHAEAHFDAVSVQLEAAIVDVTVLVVVFLVLELEDGPGVEVLAACFEELPFAIDVCHFGKLINILRSRDYGNS